jgi:hypothetical protein
VLLAIAAAYAAITCDEVRALAAAHVPDEAIVATVAEVGVLAGDLACIEALDVAETVKAAARAHVVEPPPPRPVEPEVALVVVPALPPHLAPEPLGDCRRSALYRRTPEPAVALFLGGSIGFGAGHYYAGSPVLGGVFTVADIVAGGLLIAGVAGTQPDLAIAGSATAAVSRLLQGGTAPVVAHAARIRAFEDCGQ